MLTLCFPYNPPPTRSLPQVRRTSNAHCVKLRRVRVYCILLRDAKDKLNTLMKPEPHASSRSIAWICVDTLSLYYLLIKGDITQV